VWQLSLLVNRGKRERLQRVLKEFAERWSATRRIESSGPWPPYSFVGGSGESTRRAGSGADRGQK
jgi:hypothetical protein